MASELKRGAIRLGANYGRLVIKLFMGIAFVPVMLLGLGHEGFGLIALLGSTMGIAEMCRGIIRASMKRELGTAYHGGVSDDFINAYNSSLVISAAMAGITVALFAALYFILPVLKIPEHLFGAAQWLLIAKGCYSTLVVLLGPTFNMYQISERMVLYNTWIVLDRATDFAAAVVLFVLLGMRDPAMGLITYSWLSSGTGIAVLLFAVVLIMALDRRLVPNFSRISRDEIRKILPTAGWNTVVVTAGNLHIRIDQFIMNLFFGVLGNAMFGIAVKLTSYVRIAAFGSTDGVEVVSTRLSVKEQRMTVADLTGYSTRLHAAIAIPAALLVIVLAGPVINAWIGWVGRAVEDPALIPGAVALSKVLVIGMVARGIGDSWKRILYGAGHIRAYGPAVIIGGVLNPVLAVALIYFLPNAWAYQGPAWAFALAVALVNLVWVPRIAAKCLGLRLRDVLSPIARPAIAALFSSTILWLPIIFDREDSLIALIATILLFGALHAALCWFFVLSEPERGRLTGVVARRIGLTARAAPGA